MAGLKLFRIGIWAAVVLLAVAAVYLTVAGRQPGNAVTGPIAAATVGGPFSLTDQNGATVTEAALKGHPTALFFGYTFCPDVCPTTLSDLTLYLSKLGPAGDKLKVYFVTVDPERDTQTVMADYLKAFDPRITGLTGSRPAIDQILKEYKVYSKKVAGENGAPYTMDHTATVYLLDDKAEMVGTIDYQEQPDNALAKLKRLTGTS
jgi:protein SCO1/2